VRAQVVGPHPRGRESWHGHCGSGAAAAWSCRLWRKEVATLRKPGWMHRGQVEWVRAHDNAPAPSAVLRRYRPDLASVLAGLASSAPVQQQTDLNIGMHGASLRDRGFTVLSEPVMDPDLVERARTQSQDRLAALLQRVQDLGCDPFEQEYRFKEIAQRQRRRWDLQLQEPGTGDSNSTWAQLCRAALAAADPIIREAQGEAYCGTEPVMIGAVISWPGDTRQRTMPCLASALCRSYAPLV
jgi:hypothetical protein